MALTTSVSFKGRLDRKGERGSTLLFVLAFVVLITIVTVAFLSRSLTQEQISTASSNQVKTDILEQGALDTIISDLKEEIAAGSTGTTVTTSGTTTVIYTPTSPLTAKPYLVGVSPIINNGVENDGLQNIVKESISGTSFFSGSSYSSTYTASNRAAPVHTTDLSLNSRAMTVARWNKPLLIQKATLSSDTDYTPVAAFTAPDWILVAKDGTNPTSWNANMQSSSSNRTNSSSVVGRYAYVMYNEGGVLDMNVAGRPSTGSASQDAYHGGLGFVDLTQLQDSSGNPVLTQSQVDAIVGWRNYATATGTSTSPSGSFPNYVWSTTNATNYFNATQWNQNGFLATSSPSIASNGQSDQFFSNRQALIDLMVNGIPTSATQRASLENALFYMGTFSRDINQPSYAPATSRPMIDSTQNGGGPNGGNNAYGLDNQINPSFLTVRASAAFPRYNPLNEGGSATSPVSYASANVGEPLVKKRFPLERLCWLTFKGPSATRTMTDPDITALISQYGVPQSYLQLGTAKNIQLYFGLSWDSTNSRWLYNVHNGTSGSGTTGSIMKLSDIAALGGSAHEPDFFELLKASVDVGAIAKAGTNQPQVADPHWINPNNNSLLTPLNEQYKRDISVDYAIIQLGANIISQASPSGVPVRIGFNDGATYLREFRAVENLPYLYRTRLGVLKLRESSTLTTSSGTSTASTVPTDTGVAMVMQIPELWNPSDPGSNVGTNAPTNFRLVPYSADMDSLDQGSPSYSSISIWSYDLLSSSYYMSTVAKPSGAPDLYSGPNQGGTLLNGGNGLYANNASAYHSYKGDMYLKFSVPSGDATLFREPTMLLKPNAPSSGSAQSNLALVGGTSQFWTDCTSITNTLGASVYSGGGFLSSTTNSNPMGLTGSDPLPSSSQPYIGVPLGLIPIIWTQSITKVGALKIVNLVTQQFTWVDAAGVPYLTYQLQYQDPATSNWYTYDEKGVLMDASWLGIPIAKSTNPTGGLLSLPVPVNIFIDPRTPRFGAFETDHVITNQQAPVPCPEFYGSSQGGWIDSNNDVLVSERPDAQTGYGPAADNLAGNIASGWHFGAAGTLNNPYGTVNYVKTGLFSQNSLISSVQTQNSGMVSYGYKFNGDTQPGPTVDPQFYTDPDGVLRRAMGGYVNTSTMATPGTTVGLPLTRSLSYASGNTAPSAQTRTNQFQSRPFFLHRPFKSVAELGVVFSGTPWKNVDFNTPESGYSALLDTFCVNETDYASTLTAGKVDLNTRQQQVINCILSGSYKDESNSSTVTLSSTEGAQIASALVARTAVAPTAGPAQTANTPQPIVNIGDIVGRWYKSTTISAVSTSSPQNIDGSQSYDGFSGDLTSIFNSSDTSLSSTNISRFRESAVRALSGCGMARVWNLMIDLVVQTGQYPPTATGLTNFNVQSERRYWVHLAIDRATGAVVAKQIESVKE